MKHQKKLREMYNPDDVFKSKKKQELSENEIPSEEIQENVAMVEYKRENLIDKIKRFFANIFKK